MGSNFYLGCFFLRVVKFLRAAPGFFFSRGVSSGGARNLSWEQLKNKMINFFLYIYTTSILYTIIQNKYNLVDNTAISYNSLQNLLMV